MPILSPIGRRQPRVRGLVAAMYAALILGAATTVYPFLLMLAGSSKSGVDRNSLRLVPRFLVHDDDLYRKYAEGLFNEYPGLMRAVYEVDAPSFAALEPPRQVNGRLVDLWEKFLREAPPEPFAYTLGFVYAPQSRGALPHELRAWKRELARAAGGELAALNRALETDFASWNSFLFIPEDHHLRRNVPEASATARAFRGFKAGRPAAERFYFNPEGYYREFFLRGRYGRDLAAYNREHGTAYASWDAITLDATGPAGPGRTAAERADWETFVRTLLNLRWIRAGPAAAAPYREFLAAKYRTVDALNRAYGTAWPEFAAVPLYDADADPGGLARADWDAVLQGWTDPDGGRVHRIPADLLRVETTASRFWKFAQANFQTLDELNRALGTNLRAWSELRPPQREWHYRWFLAHRGKLRREFVARNFLTVFDYVAVRGRALFNTLVYCGLAVLAALVVNPLAAYALSRWRRPAAYQVLLFLMLTMAFPPMVTQIPVFLMLRSFDLLNTFWALILPGLANGYSIFLLKGFFDAHPRELYECAEIDGAGELRIFWHIALSLSKPILAVIALNAFVHAYSNFMFALLICQDERMWTIMPWLYQLQQQSGPGVVYASLLVAAVPTLLVFTLCQKVILQGIVIPVEK
jgi:ABC-type glycerol-3-phosphate transport system permease component